MAHPIPSTIVGIAGVFTLGLTIIAYQALRSSGDKRLWGLTLGFFLLFCKSILTVYDLQTGLLGHERIEYVGSIIDMLVAVSFISPFFIKT